MYIFTIFKPFGLENCVDAYRRGLLRCSFGLQGNAKASNRGTSDRTDSRAFFFCTINRYFISPLGIVATEKGNIHVCMDKLWICFFFCVRKYFLFNFNSIQNEEV